MTNWDLSLRTSVISAVCTALALIVALLAWLWPREPGGGKKDEKAAGTNPATATATATGTGTRPPAPAGGTVTPVFLNSSAFPPESGAADLVEVPRAIRGKAGWTGHEIAVRCPSNQTGDSTSDVTYLLRGRYARFDVTVHPYYPEDADRQAVTHVTAFVAVRTVDGGLDTTVAGVQKAATYTAEAGLSVSVEDAEKLTLRVECGDPNGTVVLTGARLTPV
ncbi:hypothetical protein [Actinoplanes sp. G11-F43]|uniref:hypothetical protein n=1 Tax=Actinoplanes sp. G11-F43 TaxID=3424130 RepID=UPI003D352E9C